MDQPPKGDLWLRVNYWTLENISLLKKWWVIILLGCTVFFVVFATTNAVLYAISLPREARLMASLADPGIAYHELRSAQTPGALSVGNPVTIPAAGSTVDLAVSVKNVNQSWTAGRFRLTFLTGQQEIGQATGILMPGQESYIAIFGQTVPKNASITTRIDDVVWRRAPTGSRNLEDTFTIQEPEYTRVEQVNPVRTVGTATAQVTNLSLDGFWRVGFVITLFRNGTLVGINHVILDNVEPQSTRTVTGQWSPAPSAVDTVRISPQIDLLDPDVMMR